MAERTVLTKGELLERTGAAPEDLERWIDSGLVQAEGKASSGAPYFTEETVHRVEHIGQLLAIGYAEEEVGKILRKVGPPQSGKSDGERKAAENLLTVGALAESVGVSPRTIKHWEEKGIIDADARSEGGFRLFKEHYVHLCYLIQDLQLFGYSLDQIKQISDYFRDFVIMRDDLAHYPPDQADEKLTGMLSEIDLLFDRNAKLRSGIERWEKLLNKHRKLIADLKRSNDKRMAKNV
ncbi:MAG: MerR family transcriptional regulator [Spirochaetaceae bacterium]